MTKNTQETIRLGAITTVTASDHSLHNQQGRYMGPTELPGMENSHRICFDGKVHLLQRQDFVVEKDKNNSWQSEKHSTYWIDYIKLTIIIN